MAAKTRTESDTEKLLRHNRELTILNHIAAALNREADLPRALETALAQVAELFDLETAWIFLGNPETKRFYAAAAQNLPPALADHPRRMGGTCYCLDEFRDGSLGHPRNITCTRLENLVVGTRGLRYHASIPLQARDKPLGVLNVASTDWEELSEDDLKLLYLVGDLVSIAIERAKLFAQSAEIGAISERNRLAREIHDTIAQGMAAIALQLETAEALMESGNGAERVQQIVHQALKLTRANLEEARRSVMDLRAAPLEGRTLPDALADLVEHCRSQSGVTMKFEVTGNRARPLPIRVASGLYRIGQEALTNVMDHAQARTVRVQLESALRSDSADEEIHLVIEDDGMGFDPTRIREGHFGLIGLTERARLLGGTLHVSSTPGVGTRVEVIVPLEGSHDG